MVIFVWASMFYHKQYIRPEEICFDSAIAGNYCLVTKSILKMCQTVLTSVKIFGATTFSGKLFLTVTFIIVQIFEIQKKNAELDYIYFLLH